MKEITVNKTEVSHYIDNIIETIGNTPLIKLHKVCQTQYVNLYVKCEMFNPSFSIKDRIVLSMIRDFEKSGQLKPGGTIIEASSGNTGSALAMLAASLGYKAIITVPEKTSNEKVLMMQIYGATVHVCPGSAAKSSPEHYVNKAKILAEKMPAAIFLNQYENSTNPETHYQQTAVEIWQQLNGDVDYVVATASSGGTISGIGNYLKSKNPDVKVIMPDPIGSIYHHYFHHHNLDVEYKSFKVEGIGKDYICGNIDFNVIDDVTQVNDEQAFAAVKQLACSEGIFAGLSSGTAIHAALALAKELDKEQVAKNIVVVLSDTGLKYLSKL